MGPQLMAASAAITLALILYTLAIFASRHTGSLKAAHAILIWCGFIADAAGTVALMAAEQALGDETFARFAAGALACAIILFHGIWATLRLVRHPKEPAPSYQQLSTLVWLLWLIPYLTGLLIGIPAVHLAGIPSLALSTMVVLVFAAMLRHIDETKRDKAPLD